jgi:ABC-2 type transport system permease protein
MADTRMVRHSAGAARAPGASPAEREPTSGHRAPSMLGPPRVWHVIARQTGYAHRDFWRNPVLAFVTLGFPLAFLIMIGLASLEAPPDPVTGAGAIQSMAPIAAVFATVMAAYVMLPFGISRARELGVLKRLRGTPLPLPAYLAGRLLVALWVALLGTGLMLVSAVAVFDLVIPWQQVPAMVLTFVVGVLCFAALGVAAAALLPSSPAVLAFTMGSFLIVAFGSGVFAPDLALPRPLDVGSWFLPLRHFSEAFIATFQLTANGAGVAWDHLAVLAGWTVLGAAIGLRWLWSEPAIPDRPARDPEPTTAASTVRDAVAAGPTPAGDRPGFLALMWPQLRYANHQVWREPSSVFFAVLFPALFVVVVPYAFGSPVIDGVEFARLVTPSMAVFGAVVTAYVNMPEQLALARERGVLKRLRGTPLPAAAYLTGRLGSTLWVGGLAVVCAYLAGGLVHGAGMPVASIAPTVVVFLVGIPALAALGFAIVALVPQAKMVPAVALGTFLPLAFISGMFAFGFDLPDGLATIGWIFPFKHLVHANEAAYTTATIAPGHLGVVALWGAAAAAIAAWRFRWD